MVIYYIRVLSAALLLQGHVVGFWATSYVSAVTCFSSWFSRRTVREEIVYLSEVPVSHVEYLCSRVSFVWKLAYFGFCCCLDFVLCSGALFFFLRVGFCTFVASQEDIMHRWGPNMASNLKQFVQRFPVRDFWLPVFEFVFNSFSISRAMFNG